MKEVTKWNNHPRYMWCWDEDWDRKEKLFVVGIEDNNVQFPVMAFEAGANELLRYAHCAEIGVSKRMTHKQLSRWLSEKPGRECKDGARYVFPYLSYKEDMSNKEVSSFIRIRENDGEWREPIIEDEE